MADSQWLVSGWRDIQQLFVFKKFREKETAHEFNTICH